MARRRKVCQKFKRRGAPHTCSALSLLSFAFIFSHFVLILVVIFIFIFIVVFSYSYFPYPPSPLPSLLPFPPSTRSLPSPLSLLPSLFLLFFPFSFFFSFSFFPFSFFLSPFLPFFLLPFFPSCFIFSGPLPSFLLLFFFTFFLVPPPSYSFSYPSLPSYIFPSFSLFPFPFFHPHIFSPILPSPLPPLCLLLLSCLFSYLGTFSSSLSLSPSSLFPFPAFAYVLSSSSICPHLSPLQLPFLPPSPLSLSLVSPFFSPLTSSPLLPIPFSRLLSLRLLPSPPLLHSVFFSQSSTPFPFPSLTFSPPLLILLPVNLCPSLSPLIFCPAALPTFARQRVVKEVEGRNFSRAPAKEFYKAFQEVAGRWKEKQEFLTQSGRFVFIPARDGLSPRAPKIYGF
ncbi:hypothetical protein C7M84_011523 [Penaeus vannamei]|uniref:Uncharacterized protein n=1 Tax=Penaeus vannamei TaxID=6689 RepID=A0A423T108_PENVA|nr:hypothetical protein C7M84_011523 [Penaeus vannamei]